MFAEAPVWRSIGAGWRPLFGSFEELGFSFEFHDFSNRPALDWGRSFHPGGVEVCLNLDGEGTIQSPDGTIRVPPGCTCLYYQGAPPLTALRQAGLRHRFITVEFSAAYLAREFSENVEFLHPLVRRAIQGTDLRSEVQPVEPIPTALLAQVDSLQRCPVFSKAREIWFRSKALEFASCLFFRPAEGELFCTRAQRLGRERVERAKILLREMMHEPPSLEELGRLVGCSPFYLSRLFSQGTGMTIQQYLRRIRLERAAELLRTGKCNVTEAAMEVGYSSLSHFSTSFRELFGCCPGLYPLKTPSQAGRS
ncbi:MAG: helix-turn-helix transcriptional regulator [Limisphaerales bacterium]